MGLFSRRDIGDQYETLAKRYLISQGLTFLEQNFSTKNGEIDLIFRQGDALVFVEVKYRQSKQFGHAAEMVTTTKMKRIVKAAHYWLTKRGLSLDQTEVRFDVVAIHQDGKEIDWIQNAITQG